MSVSYLSTRKEFESCLLHFYNDIQSCPSESQSWTWEIQSILKHAYLKKTNNFIISSTRSTLTPFMEQDNMVTEELDPTLSIITTAHVEMIQLEHHVVYSPSYQVPVLYVKVFYQDGTPLSLTEIYQHIVPNIYHNQVIITQTEHPLLNKPFWFIHPCDTRKLMNTIQFEYLDYIKTWLSFNGPIFKCNLAKEMFVISG